MELVGRTLGQYQIVEELGRGGMAVVYKSFQPALNRYVAIKVLPPQFAFDEQFVQRFLREARGAAALHHPNIVTIHDINQQEGLYFIVMEYIQGETLDQLLARSGPLPLERISRVVSQVADALENAHQQGLIHRDIKPSNIMVDERRNDHVTLMDFGLVRAAEGTGLTRTGTIVGTPEYMSPEQGQGEQVDSRTDIYSLGVVIFKMLTGQVPFSRSTPHAVLIAHMTQDPPSITGISPSLPRAMEAVVRKAMAKDREARYAHASELARDVATAATGQMPAGLEAARKAEAAAPPAERTQVGAEATVVHRPPAAKAPKKKGWLWGLGAVGAILLLGVCGVVAAFALNVFPLSTPASPALSATPVPAEEEDVKASRTPTPKAIATPTPRPTSPPKATSTPTPKPTPSLEATSTRLPSPTPTATETPQPRPTAAPTTPPRATAPEPVAPSQGGTYPNPVTFQWNGSLGAGQSYQVTARHTESGQTVQSGLLAEQSWTASLPGERYGEWRWTVAVVQGGGTTATSSEWMFWFKPGGSGGGGGGDGGDGGDGEYTPEPP